MTYTLNLFQWIKISFSSLGQDVFEYNFIDNLRRKVKIMCSVKSISEKKRFPAFYDLIAFEQ